MGLTVRVSLFVVVSITDCSCSHACFVLPCSQQASSIEVVPHGSVTGKHSMSKQIGHSSSSRFTEAFTGGEASTSVALQRGDRDTARVSTPHRCMTPPNDRRRRRGTATAISACKLFITIFPLLLPND